MPILLNSNLQQSISQIEFRKDGSMNVVIDYKMDDLELPQKSFLLSPEETASLLDVAPDQPTIRASVLSKVYTYLLQSEKIKGTFAP
jgi:hypothetical protein